MVVSYISDTTAETTDEAISNDELDNLILNTIKSIRNVKSSIIYEYLNNSLPSS